MKYWMRKLFMILLLWSFTGTVYSQISLAYHQSELSFIEVAYEINDRWVPSARIGTNLLFEDFVLELAGLYQFKEADVYEAYAGGGLRLGYGLSSDDNVFLVLPVGLNIFPFERKGFGFQMELAPMFGGEAILRGSFGIRYRFDKE